MEEIQDNKNTEPLPAIREYLQPALLITLVTAFCYYIGYSYTSAFFNRFGIQNKFIDLPTSYYLMESSSSIILGIVIIYFLYFYKTEDLKIKRFKENAYIFIFSVLYLYQAIIERSYFNLGISVLLLLWFIILIYINKPYEFKGFIGKIIIVCMAIPLMSSLSSLLGRQHAKQTIEGSGPGIIFVKMKTKTNVSDINKNDNKFILIIHNDKKYYLVKQENPAPLNPLVYVIPDDQVEFVVLNKSIE